MTRRDGFFGYVLTLGRPMTLTDRCQKLVLVRVWRSVARFHFIFQALNGRFSQDFMRTPPWPILTSKTLAEVYDRSLLVSNWVPRPLRCLIDRYETMSLVFELLMRRRGIFTSHLMQIAWYFHRPALDAQHWTMDQTRLRTPRPSIL